jgi:hypothetical protein
MVSGSSRGLRVLGSGRWVLGAGLWKRRMEKGHRKGTQKRKRKRRKEEDDRAGSGAGAGVGVGRCWMGREVGGDSVISRI